MEPPSESRRARFRVHLPPAASGGTRARSLNREGIRTAGFSVLLAGVAAVAACTPAVAPVPPPAQTLTATRTGQTCLVSGLAIQGPTTGKLVGVDLNPTGAVARWMPGMNATHCSISAVQLTAAQAGHLARDINSAPTFPTGVMHCPMDDATAVQLIFSYADHAPEGVIMGLTGCAYVTAPGRSGRRMSVQLRADLAAVAPPDWLTYLSP